MNVRLFSNARYMIGVGFKIFCSHTRTKIAPEIPPPPPEEKSQKNETQKRCGTPTLPPPPPPMELYGSVHVYL